MYELERIREALSDMNIKAVARGAGVKPNAIYRLMAGDGSPRYETVHRLSVYLEKKHKEIRESHG